MPAVRCPRPVARNVQRAARALTAAHSQNDRLGVQLKQSVGLVHGGDGLVRRQIQHHRVELVFNSQFAYLRHKPCRVLGAGQLLFKGMQAEAIVDALVQDAAQLVVAL